MSHEKTAIVWFTNNLRVNDNHSLHLATHNFKKVIAVYCVNPKQFEENKFGFKKTEKYRAKFLLESLYELSKNLNGLNISLLIYHQEPHVVLNRLCEEYKANAIFFQKEFTQEECKQINLLKKSLPKQVTIFEQYEQFLYHPEDIPFSIIETPKVFTDFRKKVERFSTIRLPYKSLKKEPSNLIHTTNAKIINLTDLGFKNFTINKNSAFPFLGGENKALERMQHYFFETQKIASYKKTRNGLIGVDYSSKLSAWLANGSISAKTIYFKLKEFEKKHISNQSTYWLIFELLWRDFFKYIALKNRNKLFKIDGISQRKYYWSTDSDKILSWINAETDEPFVNANMIEIRETGWMSNRGRQNVASYFTKELNLDWRIGANYFESMLIDYDVHSNYGNWQYLAGVGNDPRDRKFNIKLQSERYDKNFSFRKLWL